MKSIIDEYEAEAENHMQNKIKEDKMIQKLSEKEQHGTEERKEIKITKTDTKKVSKISEG